MNKLLKDAIADAKAVRETALANAKLALEEAFAPKLQSMLSTKIREEMEEEEPEMDAEETDEMARMQELAGISEEGDEEMSSDEEDMGDDDMGGEEDFSDEGGEEDFSDEGGEEDYSDDEDMSSDEGEEEMSSDDEDLEEILRELEDEESSESTDEESMMEGPGMGAAQDPDASEEENAFWQMMNSLEEGMSDSEAVQVLKAAKKDPKFMDKLKKAFNEGEGSDEEMDINEIIRSLREEESEEDAEQDDEEIDLNELLASLNEEEEEEEEKESKMEGRLS